jgi:hypothetical protein
MITNLCSHFYATSVVSVDKAQSFRSGWRWFDSSYGEIQRISKTKIININSLVYVQPKLESFFKIRGFHGIKIKENKEILVLAYTDDVVLFSKSPVDLRDKLQTLKEYCRGKGLTINTEKTKIMVFIKTNQQKALPNI